MYSRWFWGPFFGPFGDHFGTYFPQFGPKLGPSWPQVRPKLAPSWVMRAILGPSCLPGTPSGPPKLPQGLPKDTRGTLQAPSGPPRDPSGTPRDTQGPLNDPPQGPLRDQNPSKFRLHFRKVFEHKLTKIKPKTDRKQSIDQSIGSFQPAPFIFLTP